jgi:hypothetical protein
MWKETTQKNNMKNSVFGFGLPNVTLNLENWSNSPNAYVLQQKEEAMGLVASETKNIWFVGGASTSDHGNFLAHTYTESTLYAGLRYITSQANQNFVMLHIAPNPSVDGLHLRASNIQFQRCQEGWNIYRLLLDRIAPPLPNFEFPKNVALEWLETCSSFIMEKKFQIPKEPIMSNQKVVCSAPPPPPTSYNPHGFSLQAGLARPPVRDMEIHTTIVQKKTGEWQAGPDIIQECLNGDYAVTWPDTQQTIIVPKAEVPPQIREHPFTEPCTIGKCGAHFMNGKPYFVGRCGESFFNARNQRTWNVGKPCDVCKNHSGFVRVYGCGQPVTVWL